MAATAGLFCRKAATVCCRGHELLHSGQARLGLIAAGGEGDWVEADSIAYVLTQMGIEKERLLLERSSLNTRQNALGAKQIVREKRLKRLVLVTSAFHMERALQCFRAVGLEPDALPCDEQAPGAGSLFQLLAPRARPWRSRNSPFVSCWGGSCTA